MRPASALACLCLLAGCADPYLRTDLSAADMAAPYPDLLPAETIRARVPEPRTAPEAEATLEARADRLRARAASLRRPAIDGEARARLQQGAGN